MGVCSPSHANDLVMDLGPQEQINSLLLTPGLCRLLLNLFNLDRGIIIPPSLVSVLGRAISSSHTQMQ